MDDTVTFVTGCDRVSPSLRPKYSMVLCVLKLMTIFPRTWLKCKLRQWMYSNL